MQPVERRVGPVMLPCEFCTEMFPERDLMRHQTSCDLNETSMPRNRRHSLASAADNSPTSLESPVASVRQIPQSAPNSMVNSPVSPTGKRKLPPNLPLGFSRKSETQRSNTSDNLLNVQHNTSQRSTLTASPSPKTTSKLKVTRKSSRAGSNETTDSSSDSRPTSISPCPPHSNSSSSGISSMASSTRSVSSTPSSSTSDSPIPAVVDTPTDIEADIDDDESQYAKPRRGKLLSSAIISWRSMSGGLAKDESKYSRSNTCPIEGTHENDNSRIVGSNSASQLPPLPPRSDSVADMDQSNDRGNTNSQSQVKSKPHPVFVKRAKKYRAPLPPSPVNTSSSKLFSGENRIEKMECNESDSPVTENQSRHRFKLDSKPMMNNDIKSPSPCDFCSKPFDKEEELESHKVVYSDIETIVYLLK